MRITFLFLGLSALAPHASAADFTRSASFDSVAAFVAAAKTFHPAASTSDLSSLFTVRESGQSEDPKIGTLVAATTIQSSAALWVGDVQALVFATAAPPTNDTRSSVGALFLLTYEGGVWRVADVLRFCATGKYAKVSAELTAQAGTGYHLGGDGLAPIITLKELHGGRGYSYQSSASYTLDASKFKRLDLD